MNSDCVICFEKYNDSNRKPHVLIPCGHTICGECSESIDNCPKCRKKIERKVINWDLSTTSVPSVPPQMSSITDQSNDPFWVSLRKDLVIDVEEKQKELFKALEAKQNEQQNKAKALKTKIQDEAKHKIESILKKKDELIREVDMQDSKISSELDKIFQKNQKNIEEESKFVKAKVENHKLSDVNELESLFKLKNKSDELKNKIVTKSNEIKNMKIDFKIEINEFFSEDGGLRSLPESEQSNSIAINSDESKENLIQECKKIHITRIGKLQDIDVIKVVQNPSLIDGWEKSFREFCLNTMKISIELTNQMIKNSKIINWPNKLNSIELLKKHKSEFIKLYGCGYDFRDVRDFRYDVHFRGGDLIVTKQTGGVDVRDWFRAYVFFEHHNINLNEGISPYIALVLVTSELLKFDFVE